MGRFFYGSASVPLARVRARCPRSRRAPSLRHGFAVTPPSGREADFRPPLGGGCHEVTGGVGAQGGGKKNRWLRRMRRGRDESFQVAAKAASGSGGRSGASPFRLRPYGSSLHRRGAIHCALMGYIQGRGRKRGTTNALHPTAQSAPHGALFMGARASRSQECGQDACLRARLGARGGSGKTRWLWRTRRGRDKSRPYGSILRRRGAIYCALMGYIQGRGRKRGTTNALHPTAQSAPKGALFMGARASRSQACGQDARAPSLTNSLCPRLRRRLHVAALLGRLPATAGEAVLRLSASALPL